MAKQINTIIILRNDSTANWLANADHVLKRGEIGIEFLENDIAKIKIGDGIRSWAELPYHGGDLYKGDDVSIDVIDNVIKIKGFDEAAIGAQLVKGEDGTLTWKIPDTTEVDNLKLATQNLRVDVNTLAGIVGTAATEESGATGIFAALETKANAADVYTKQEIDSKISSAYNYRGTVANYSDLPTEGMQIGDVYNIENADPAMGIEAGSNVAWNGYYWDKLAGVVDLSGYATKEDIADIDTALAEIPAVYLAKEQAAKMYQKIGYEITSTPSGTLVDYREKEIRVMCPANTQWVKQNVGATGNANMYYMGFKAYAPEGAVGFKEGDQGVIEDEYFDFTGDFAGTDKYGRNYSIVWLPLASYDTDADIWTYFGERSSVERYIGWTYVVEWYNAEGVVIASDRIRINLSNESCHSAIEPYYMGSVLRDTDNLILYGGNAE